MIRQLAFDLPAKDALTRDAFFTTPANALALAAVDGWRDWPLGKMLLVGPPGSGKSHLAQIWAGEAGATVVAGAGLAGQNLPALAAAGAVAVEDAEAVAGQPQDETALFHLHNLLAGNGPLLVTSRMPPRDWGLRLPDLMSRLQAAPVTRLAAPDDALLSAVLVKLFADRQVAVSPALILFLVARMPRSIGAARELVARLDARALAQGRPVSRALAAEVLDSGEAG